MSLPGCTTLPCAHPAWQQGSQGWLQPDRRSRRLRTPLGCPYGAMGCCTSSYRRCRRPPERPCLCPPRRRPPARFGAQRHGQRWQHLRRSGEEQVQEDQDQGGLGRQGGGCVRPLVPVACAPAVVCSTDRLLWMGMANALQLSGNLVYRLMISCQSERIRHAKLGNRSLPFACIMPAARWLPLLLPPHVNCEQSPRPTSTLSWRRPSSRRPPAPASATGRTTARRRMSGAAPRRGTTRMPTRRGGRR